MAPSTCPIDLFGPVANGTILKRLQAARIFASVLHTASEPSRGQEDFGCSAQRQLNAATSGGIEQHYTSHSHDTIENLVLLRAVTAQTATGRRQSNEAIPAVGSFQHETPAAAAAAVVGRRHQEVPAARRAELDAAAAAGRARRRRRGGDVALPHGRRGRAHEVPRAGAGRPRAAAVAAAAARGAAVARDARAGRAADAADGAACNDARRRHAQRLRRAAPRARRPPGAARAHGLGAARRAECGEAAPGRRRGRLGRRCECEWRRRHHRDPARALGAVLRVARGRDGARDDAGRARPDQRRNQTYLDAIDATRTRRLESFSRRSSSRPRATRWAAASRSSPRARPSLLV